MITTVTLNVSVDKAYEIKGSVQPGTVSRVEKVSNSAGGKGLNVARSVAFCGEDVIATGFAGGFNGAYVKDLLQKDGIKSRFVETESETRSCINILAEDGTSTEYLEPGAPVSTKELESFIKEFWDMIGDSEVVTISGSIPKGLPVNTYQKLITMIKSQGKKVILDTSGEYLKDGIKASPTMIKPNQEELEAILGIQIDSRESLIRAAQAILRFGVEQVVVSLGSDGALAIATDKILHGKPPKIDALNPVGCGDSMVGAFAVSMKQNKSMEDSLRYAIAVSAANAMNPETGRFCKEDMEEIMPRVQISEVKI